MYEAHWCVIHVCLWKITSHLGEVSLLLLDKQYPSPRSVIQGVRVSIPDLCIEDAGAWGFYAHASVSSNDIWPTGLIDRPLIDPYPSYWDITLAFYLDLRVAEMTYTPGWFYRYSTVPRPLAGWKGRKMCAGILSQSLPMLWSNTCANLRCVFAR